MRAIRRYLERRPRDTASYSAANLQTLAALGFAASLLFAALTVIAFRTGDGDDGGTRVLGATVEPTGDFEVASTEGGAFFTYTEDPRDQVAGSATVIVRDEGEVSLTVAGQVEGDQAVLSATVQNGTAGDVLFAGGLSVAIDVSLGGVLWRTLEPSDRAITGLGPGESATVSTTVPLDEFGEYELSGEVLFTRA